MSHGSETHQIAAANTTTLAISRHFFLGARPQTVRSALLYAIPFVRDMVWSQILTIYGLAYKTCLIRKKVYTQWVKNVAL